MKCHQCGSEHHLQRECTQGEKDSNQFHFVESQNPTAAMALPPRLADRDSIGFSFSISAFGDDRYSKPTTVITNLTESNDAVVEAPARKDVSVYAME